MLQLKQPKVLNSKGQPVLLNEQEAYHAQIMQEDVNRRFKNSLGFEVNITTLSQIVKKVSEQSFYEIAPADYFPVRVGEGAFSSNLVTFRSFTMGDEFETGVINTGGNNARMASGDAGVDSLTIKVFNWVKGIGWNIFELEQAAKAGNWDIVAAKEKQRKTNWDLGIQRIAFLGARGDNASGGLCQGLLNMAGVNINTTVITKAISSMTVAELKTFQAAIIEAYRSNCNRTKFPDVFIIPESDYNGLASQASPDFPIKSTLQLLEEAFKLITRKPGFKILPLAYADKAYSGYAKQVYVLLNYDDATVRMDIPVDYTNTLANSLDNFNFQNAAFGQFTGVLPYRPLEVLYFQY